MLSSSATEPYAFTAKFKQLHFLLLDIFDEKKEATFAEELRRHFSSRFEAHDKINPLPFGKEFYSKSILGMLNHFLDDALLFESQLTGYKESYNVNLVVFLQFANYLKNMLGFKLVPRFYETDDEYQKSQMYKEVEKLIKNVFPPKDGFEDGAYLVS